MNAAQRRKVILERLTEGKKSLLFEVTYYKRRINFEVFHVLTDGTLSLIHI